MASVNSEIGCKLNKVSTGWQLCSCGDLHNDIFVKDLFDVVKRDHTFAGAGHLLTTCVMSFTAVMNAAPLCRRPPGPE